MVTRFAPWWILAIISVVLFGCAVVSFAQTGDFLLFLVFAGMGALVGVVGYAKRNWVERGVVPSILSYEFTRRTFGPSDNDPNES